VTSCGAAVWPAASPAFGAPTAAWINVHLHALVMDGVFARDAAGALVFHPVPRLTDLDVAEVLATLEPHVRRLLDRRGLGGGEEAGGEDAWAADAPVLAGLAAASVQGVGALGRHRGVRTRRLGGPPETIEAAIPGRCHARSNGFDLHAGLLVPAGQRARLEGVCRYALRPPVAGERLGVTGDGRVRLRLRRRWADGTTHLEWEAVDFLGRLAVLVPRPRINLLLYHGVLAPRAAWRAAVVGYTTATGGDAGAIEPLRTGSGPRASPTDGRGPARNRAWADLMRRAFGLDVLACPRCGGRLGLVALIEQAAVIQRILRHLQLPAEVPAPRPARSRATQPRPATRASDAGRRVAAPEVCPRVPYHPSPASRVRRAVAQVLLAARPIG